VGSEQFNEIEAESVGAPGGVRVSLADTRQTGLVEHLRNRPVIIERQRRWRYRRPGAGVGRERPAALPRQLGRTLTAGMGDLNPERRRTPAPAKADDPRQRRLIRIGIEAEAAMTDAAGRFDRRLLDDDECGARKRQRAQMLEMLVVRGAVFGAVLAHRRHGDAIDQGDAAEAQRFEQARHSLHEDDHIIAVREALKWRHRAGAGRGCRPSGAKTKTMPAKAAVSGKGACDSRHRLPKKGLLGA
jgi:hypothetical protein